MKIKKEICCAFVIPVLIIYEKTDEEEDIMADPRTKEELLQEIKNTESENQNYREF